MTRKRFTGWRPALGALALGIVAIGLTMQGASAEKSGDAQGSGRQGRTISQREKAPGSPVASTPAAVSATPVAISESPATPTTRRELLPNKPIPERTKGAMTVQVDPSALNAEYDDYAERQMLDPVGIDGLSDAGALEDVNGSTAGPGPGACCNDNTPACTCTNVPDMATCDGLGGVYTAGATCATLVGCDCNGNGICDNDPSEPGGGACIPIRACCNKVDGSCTDTTENNCVLANGYWNPSALCGGAMMIPYRRCSVSMAACNTNAQCPAGQTCNFVGAGQCLGGTNAGNPCTVNANCPGSTCQFLPQPACNLQGTCSWDNGAPLNDRGRPRSQADIGLGSGVVDDFIINDKVNPSNPCQINSISTWWVKGNNGPEIQQGVNVTVYANDAASKRPPEGGIAPVRGVGGHPVVPGANEPLNQHTNRYDVNGDGDFNDPEDIDVPGGIVYSQHITAGSGRITVTPLNWTTLDGTDCGGFLARFDVDMTPGADLVPLILNKNRKYWFEMQVVQPAIAQQWFIYSSVKNTLNRARSGFQPGGGAFWTVVTGNSGATTPPGGTGGVCQPGTTPQTSTRLDMAFLLNGIKDSLPIDAPANDLCANAADITDGTLAFHNDNATTDGAATDCGFNIANDVWYLYTSTCQGTILIDTCGSEFDTALAVYPSPPVVCTPPAMSDIACNNSPTSGKCLDANPGSTAARIEIGTDANTDYLIRVGGKNAGGGKGRLRVECIPACGNPKANDCCQPMPPFTAGCSDAVCCNIVCAVDPVCCGVLQGVYDVVNCAALANQEPSCACPCTVPFDMSKVQETEACGADLNGGCNNDPDPATYQDVMCGDDIAGTGWADGNMRDTDWYRFSVTDSNMDGVAQVDLSLTSSSQFGAFIVDITDCTNPIVLGETAHSGSCVKGIAQVCVPAPGTYAVFVGQADMDGNGIFNGNPCAGPPNEDRNRYNLGITCADTCQPGACCLCTGSCIFVTEAECTTMSGIFQDIGLACMDAECVADRVHTAQAAGCGTINANLTAAACGTNSDCEGMVPSVLVPTCDTDYGTCVDGDFPDFECDNEGPHTGCRWYTITATHTSMSVSTCDNAATNPAQIDSVIDLWTRVDDMLPACAGLWDNDDMNDNLVPVDAVNACADDTCGPSAFLSHFCATGLTIGETYYLRICAWDGSVLGPYEIDVRCPCIGACCLDSGPTCTDNEAVENCTGSERFAPLVWKTDPLLSGTCAGLVPGCGVGACCLTAGGCNNVASESACMNGNFFPGANCGTIICPVAETCSYDNGEIPFLGRANSTQYAPGDVYFEVADDFTLKGTGDNMCQIESILWRVSHFNHDDDPPNPACPTTGGGTSMCCNCPDDYDSIRVTIYNDTGLPAGAGKGPTGQPNYIPPDPPPASPLHLGVFKYELIVPGPGLMGPPPGGGHWYEYTPDGADPNEHVITMHFDPPIKLEKNKKNWLAIAPEVQVTGFYQTAWNHSSSYNGNPAQQYFPDILGPNYIPIAPVDPTDPLDMIFVMTGVKQSLNCEHTTCQLYGDSFPDSNGATPGGEVGNCVVDVDDISCSLDGFAGILPCAINADIHPCPVPNAVIDVDDISSHLDAFAGIIAAACSHPCAGACCGGGGSCTHTNGSDCVGTYAGDGTVCTDIPDPCP